MTGHQRRRMFALEQALKTRQGCLTCGFRLAADDIDVRAAGFRCRRCGNDPLAFGLLGRAEAPSVTAVGSPRPGEAS